jgi:Ca2+-binding EF-hand superfamily protein
MDTLINGDEDEKLEFSFALIDKYGCEYFGFEEFKEVISKIIAHWCIITGSHVKVDDAGLRETFSKLDTNGDGNVDIDEYKRILKENPMLFEWFDLLN